MSIQKVEEKTKKENREVMKSPRRYSLITLISIAILCFLFGILANRFMMQKLRRKVFDNNQKLESPIESKMGIGRGMDKEIRNHK
jgi:hypothetical protein